MSGVFWELPPVSVRLNWRVFTRCSFIIFHRLPEIADGFLMFIVPESVRRDFHPTWRVSRIDRRYGELNPRCGSGVQPGVLLRREQPESAKVFIAGSSSPRGMLACRGMVYGGVE